VIQRISFVLLALGFVAGASAARAQQRPIAGKVVSAATSEPIAGASVTVVGTAVAAVTNAQGEFSLSGPGGAVSLLVRSVGHTHRQVSVAADQSTVTVSLEQDVFNLEAVVVTGQATGVEQRNLANSVTTVNADQLNRAPTQTIESALQGKIPGAVIQMNSGAPGGGGQINLRGVTTINAGVDPLIVVDGIVIANDAIASNMNAITAAAAGGNASNQDNPVNRIADLNPDDIASINVLKGASAAAIYGSQAANGVLIINTRRGQAGAPRFSVTQRLGTSDVLSNLTSRVFADSVAADAAFGGAAQAYCKLPGGKCPYYDNSGVLYGNRPLSVETDASVTGGNDQTTYYISGLIKKDGAVATNTDYQKQGVRANVDQVLGPRFKLSINLNAIHSLSDRGISNNDNTGTSPFLVFPSTPSFINLSPTCDPTRATCYPVNPFAPSNPLQTMAILKNAEDVWRLMNTSTLNVDAVTTATQHVRFTVTGGIDYFSQRNDILSPADLQYEPQDGFPGTVVLGKASDLRENIVGSVVHTYTPPSNAFQATTSAGFQYENRDLNITNIVGRTIGLGLQNVNQAAFVSSNQSEQPVRNLGIYGQEEVIALEQKLLLTVGARVDRSSLNGDPSHYFLYPKAAASYRFEQPMGGVDEVKARVAWGQTGNPPLFYYRGTLDSTSAIGGLVGQYRALQLGDASITPERNTELEGGIDATFGNQFATLGVTVYQKTISDLLLQESVAPSTGYQFRVFNGGRLRNRGVEASLAVSPVRNPDVNWVLRSTFYLNRSLVETLPVPAFNTGGFGTSLGAYRIEVGKSATQIVGTEGVVGDANPNFQMSFASDLNYKRLSFGFLWDWKSGGDVINLTQLLYDAAGNSADQVPAGNTRISTWAGGHTAVYVQSGTYLKLRELTLGYDVPADIPSHFGMRTMRISLSGRNLLKFSPYQGLDPEVSNFGNQPIARNIDVAPYPPSRSFFFSVDFGF
jgi:TonB-linked SusC/RagA family outer membrane protein